MKAEEKRFMAIDPKTGVLWAAYRSKRVGKLGVIGLPPLMRPQLIAVFKLLKRVMGITDVVYEDCYAHRNMKTFAALSHLREDTRCAARAAGLHFVVVSPSAWQKEMFSNQKLKGKRMLRDDTKTFAKWHASAMLGFDVDNEDIADAMCLLDFATNKAYAKQFSELCKKDKKYAASQS